MVLRVDDLYRLKKNDWKIMYNPRVKIIHYRGASSGIIKDSRRISTASQETKLMAAKASVEAMRLFYQKHYSDKYPGFVYRLVLGGIGLLSKFRMLKFSRQDAE